MWALKQYYKYLDNKKSLIRDRNYSESNSAKVNIRIGRYSIVPVNDTPVSDGL